ncbi:Hypothetical predicted protein [Lecanosticta acicola]|uniref:Glycosyltransferase family 8 protein n=1 Tax=Lecanosticta acicola TaxID=111012 RepID=A0AAI9EAT4_9PEZI|nr:Hypothetical predicted protein [Lecanosticta acicola]
MANQRGWRYLIVALLVLLVIAVYLQDSVFSTKSAEYVKDFLKTHASPDQTASAIDSSFDETELAQPSFDLPIDPPNEPPASSIDGTTPPAVEENTGYMPDKLFFELELDGFALPSFDTSKLRTLPPHNYKGQGHPTFAAFFLSRNSSLHDPYFLSTHQVIYRLLWKSDTKSATHPVVVFVAPFVPDEIRASFQAAGALVREVETIPFHPETAPDGNLLAHRFRDVFTKLQMWSQTDFSRIAFLDSDAYPLVNIDALLDDQTLIPDQTCRAHLLQEEDVPHTDELCPYVFTGARDLGFSDMVNAGVMVLSPNTAMYTLLMRERQNTSNYDPGYPEQAFLSHIFRPDGPFPAGQISSAWNGDPKVKVDGGELYILHAKLWVIGMGGHGGGESQGEGKAAWLDGMFSNTWEELRGFYEGEAFLKLREMDGVLVEEEGLQQ